MAAIQTVSRFHWVILGLAVVAQISGALVGVSLPPLAPLFQRDLELSKAEVGLFISAAYAGGLAVLVITGSLNDRYGVRKVVSASQLLEGALLLSVALSLSGLQAVALIFLAGAARSPVLTGSTKAIMEWFPPRIRATAMGVKQTGGALAGIGAAALLPALGLAVGWRLALAVVGVFTIIAGGAMALVYRRPASTVRSAEPGPSMRASLAAVVRSRRLWTVACVALLFGAAQQCFSAYVALYLHEVVLPPLIPEEGARIVAAGGYLAVAQFGGVVGRVSWGAVSDRLLGGDRLGLLAAIGTLAALMVVAVTSLEPGSPVWLLTILIFCLGTTLAGWNGVFHALAVETAGRQHAATGLGLCLTLLETGMAVGPPVFGLVVDQTGSYRPAWILTSAVAAAAGLMAMLAAASSGRAKAGESV